MVVALANNSLEKLLLIDDLIEKEQGLEMSLTRNAHAGSCVEVYYWRTHEDSFIFTGPQNDKILHAALPGLMVDGVDSSLPSFIS